jgi:hypothetical protein
MELTDTKIRKSRPGDKAYRLPDSKGLFLFITPTGAMAPLVYPHSCQSLASFRLWPDSENANAIVSGFLNFL